MLERPIRRGMFVLGVAALALSIAAPAIAAAPKKKQVSFEPGVDISSWFWEKQKNEEVTTPPGVVIPPPAPPVSQRVKLRSPQSADTIPVALLNGATEKMSAVKFDLSSRDVTEGSTIKKLVITIQESVDRNEQPQSRPDAAKIQACRITDSLSAGDAEKFSDAPKFADAECVDGKREAGPAAPPGQPAVPATWTFELTPLAEPWGKNPFDYNGVMLVPVKEAGQSWQVNLKVPSLDDVSTADKDEYQLTKDRASMELEFVPGVAAPIEAPPPVDPGDDGGTTTGSTIPSSGSSGISGSPVVSGSTDLAGTGDIPGAEAASTTPQAGLGVPQDQGPQMPAYVWLAIPLGLLALSAVRSVILEPVGGPRPDGVISAIRRRNAESRGGQLAVRHNLLARLTGGFRRGGREARSTLSTLTKSIRRKKS